MPTTLRTIADRLGVSVAVVSRVLNNKPGVWASETTRQRIFDTARELNYQPSAVARALVTGRTMQLAFSTADLEWQRGRSGRLAEVVGFVQTAADRRYRVLVIPSPEKNLDPREFESFVKSCPCDGFCVYAEQAGAGLYSVLKETAIPFVVVGNPGVPSLPQVDQDNYRYSYSSVEWLAAAGHSRIAFAFDARPLAPFLQELQRGYRAAMAAHAGPVLPEWIPERRMSPEERQSYLTSPQAPTALIVNGAVELVRWRMAAQQIGLRIPEDVTLLAHLEMWEQSFLQPGDACHLHDPAQVGADAGRVLLGWIEDGKIPDQPVLIGQPPPEWR